MAILEVYRESRKTPCFRQAENRREVGEHPTFGNQNAENRVLEGQKLPFDANQLVVRPTRPRHGSRRRRAKAQQNPGLRRTRSNINHTNGNTHQHTQERTRATRRRTTPAENEPIDTESRQSPANTPIAVQELQIIITPKETNPHTLIDTEQTRTEKATINSQGCTEQDNDTPTGSHNPPISSQSTVNPPADAYEAGGGGDISLRIQQ